MLTTASLRFCCDVNMATVEWAGPMQMNQNANELCDSHDVIGCSLSRRRDRISHSHVASITVFICIGVAQPSPRSIRTEA